jgi:DNA-binding GntR family transcriptional regulator
MPRHRPLYLQLANTLRRRIRLRAFAPGAFFTSEHSLCRERKLSRVTVRRCVDVLIRDSMLVRRPGLGLFIPAHEQGGEEIRIVCRDVAEDDRIALARAIRDAITRSGFEIVHPNPAQTAIATASGQRLCRRLKATVLEHIRVFRPHADRLLRSCGPSSA